MSYTDYKESTVYNKRGKPATVRIDANNNGRIVFSMAAVKLLGLQHGDRITFRTYHQDKGIVYYFRSADGLPLKKLAGTAGRYSLAVYCRPLNPVLLKHLGFEKDKYKTLHVSDATTTLPDTGGTAWMLLKENVHQPLKWKKKQSSLL